MVDPATLDPILILVVDPAAPPVPIFKVFVVAVAVAPVPRLYVLAPVEPVPILTVCAEAVLPTLSVVAAPNAFTVVAVVLNTANVALSVTTLVVNDGLVLKTNKPVPVSSLITPANCADVVEANWLKFPVVASVPVVGNVTLVLAVVVKVNVCAPLCVKFPPSVIVLLPLLTPVPPYVGDIIVPCQVPVPIVPTVVRLELVTPLPNVVAVRTSAPLIL